MTTSQIQPHDMDDFVHGIVIHCPRLAGSLGPSTFGRLVLVHSYGNDVT